MLYRLKQALTHYFNSTTIYQEHSPYFYDLWKNVLNGNMATDAKRDLSRVRRQLKADTTGFERTDHGSNRPELRYRTSISELAGTSLSPHWKSRILHLMIRHYQLNHILELGSSLGLSSAYMASQTHSVTVTTLEGDPFLCDQAEALHRSLKLDNIQVICGPFKQTLPPTLSKSHSFDLIFIDGHHDETAVVENFDMIVDHIHERGFIIMDDIYWSPGMTRAWNRLLSHAKVKGSLAYFDLGILFFDKKWPYHPHLRWVDRWMKPWTIIHSM